MLIEIGAGVIAIKAMIAGYQWYQNHQTKKEKEDISGTHVIHTHIHQTLSEKEWEKGYEYAMFFAEKAQKTKNKQKEKQR